MSDEESQAPGGSEAPPVSGGSEAPPESGAPTDDQTPGSTPGAEPPGSSPGASTPGNEADENASGAPPDPEQTVNESNAGAIDTTKSSAGPQPSGSKQPSRTGTKSSLKAAASKRKKGVAATIDSCRIGFLGAGKLAEAIVKGLMHHTKIQADRIFVTSKSGRTLDQFKQEGCVVTKRSYDLFAKLDCDVIFIAIHGHVIRTMFKTGGSRPMALTTNYIPNQRHPIYLLSLVCGIPNSDIKKTLLNPEHPEKYKLEMHRIMLNTSVAYGLGLGALDIEPDSKKCSPIVRDLLTSFAKIEYFPEANIDATCALGGNGLAFVHYFISALSDGGFKMGLAKNTAVKLAAKTLQSAAAALLESGKHPADLRDQCTSPSGPAIYGIHILEKQDTGSGMAGAVEGAFKRIRELVDQTGK